MNGVWRKRYAHNTYSTAAKASQEHESRCPSKMLVITANPFDDSDREECQRETENPGSTPLYICTAVDRRSTSKFCPTFTA